MGVLSCEIAHGTHSKFEIGNSYIGIVKNRITEHELHYVSNDRKIVGNEIDLFFKSTGTGNQHPDSNPTRITKQKSSIKKMVRSCNCSVGHCSNKRCWCFRNGYSCSSKSHPGKTDCKNQHEVVFKWIVVIKKKEEMVQQIKTLQILHNNEPFNSYDNISCGFLVLRILMRVKRNKECLPISLNLVRQYKAQSKGKLLYGNSFQEHSIYMILKMFEEKVKEH